MIYCHASEIRIISQKDWHELRFDAEPVACLNGREAAALAWFMNYWAGEGTLRPGYDDSSINAEFDW